MALAEQCVPVDKQLDLIYKKLLLMIPNGETVTTKDITTVTTEFMKGGGKRKKKVGAGPDEACETAISPITPEFIQIATMNDEVRKKLAKLLMVTGVVQKQYAYLLKEQDIKTEFRVEQLRSALVTADFFVDIQKEKGGDGLKVKLSVDPSNGAKFMEILESWDEDCMGASMTISKDNVEKRCLETKVHDGEGGYFTYKFKITDGKVEGESIYDQIEGETQGKLQNIYDIFAKQVPSIQQVLDAWDAPATPEEVKAQAQTLKSDLETTNKTNKQYPGHKDWYIFIEGQIKTELGKKGGAGRPKLRIPKATRQRYRIPANLPSADAAAWMARAYTKAELLSSVHGAPHSIAKGALIARILSSHA